MISNWARRPAIPADDAPGTISQDAHREERIHREELRNFRYEDHWAEIDALLEIAYRFAQPRPTSGLVEQQRLFAKLREQRPK